MNLPVKVVHIITGLGTGGAETQLDLLLRHTRHPSEVVTLYNLGAVGRRMASLGIKVYDLGMRSNRQALSVLRLSRLIRLGGYDVVHVHLYRACIYGRIAAALAGVAVVVTTEHSIGETYIEGRRKTLFVRLLYLLTDRLSDATIAVSSSVRERLIEWGVPEKKIRVILNGLDFEHFTFDPDGREAVSEELGIRGSGFVIGSVGRLHPLKRYSSLIQAAAPLLKSGGWLLLVGEGPERERLQHMAREAGVADRVIFTGEREDIPRLLSTMDLFVSLSRDETFGLSILEAIAAGIRVAAVECPALDGLEVSGVRRISGDVTELRKVLLEEQAVKHHPHPIEDTVKQRYEIRNIASAVDDLYEALLKYRRGS